MRTQWTTKGNQDAGSSCSCDQGLHRYLRNFGEGGLNTPNPPSVRHWGEGTKGKSPFVCIEVLVAKPLVIYFTG